MIIKPIRNDDELKTAFQRLEMVFQAESTSPEADEVLTGEMTWASN